MAKMMATNGTTDMVLKKLRATAWNPIFSLEKILIVMGPTCRYLMNLALAFESYSRSSSQMSFLKKFFSLYVFFTNLFMSC